MAIPASDWELWCPMTNSEINIIETAYRLCVKSMQDLPKRTRTVITHIMLGVRPHFAFPLFYSEILLSHSGIPMSHSEIPLSHIPLSHSEIPLSHSGIPLSHSEMSLSHSKIPLSHSEIPLYHSPFNQGHTVFSVIFGNKTGIYD